MGVEHVKLYKKLELDLHTDQPATFEVYTELPQWDVRLRYTVSVTTGPGRVPVAVMLPGNVRGRYIKLKLHSAGVTRLYGARVWAKVTGMAEPQAWQWYPVPIEITPEEYSSAGLPIQPTEEGYAAVDLPIEPTPEGFSATALPIEPTPEGFSEATLPIEPTSEGFGAAALPFAQTDQIPTWAEIPIDPPE
jgi:hypothetical protein